MNLEVIKLSVIYNICITCKYKYTIKIIAVILN